LHKSIIDTIILKIQRTAFPKVSRVIKGNAELEVLKLDYPIKRDFSLIKHV
jgi:hypothetical protein